MPDTVNKRSVVLINEVQVVIGAARVADGSGNPAGGWDGWRRDRPRRKVLEERSGVGSLHLLVDQLLDLLVGPW